MSSEKSFPSKKDYELADKLASENKTDLSFIKEYKIDEGLCDDLIEFFNKTPLTYVNPWFSKKPGINKISCQKISFLKKDTSPIPQMSD